MGIVEGEILKITIVIENEIITVVEERVDLPPRSETSGPGPGHPPGVPTHCSVCGKAGFNMRTHGEH